MPEREALARSERDQRGNGGGTEALVSFPCARVEDERAERLLFVLAAAAGWSEGVAYIYLGSFGVGC